MIRIVFYMLLLSLWFVSCGQPQEDEKPLSREYPDQVMDSSSVVFTRGGVRRAVLYADEIQIFSKRRRTKAFKVRVEFEAGTNEGKGLLLADSALVSDGQRIVEVFGNVSLKTGKGTHLTTTYLHWDTVSDRITSDKAVRIERSGQIIEGIGLRTDVNLNRIVIEKEVSGEMGEP
ncbi:LPS export ABC transporter periplasmic protein LptC [bacterium]|nr:MAG: LPS export ABC transporter periplasmic protein LptC [bacterium]